MLTYVACITAASIILFFIENVSIVAACLMLVLTFTLIVLFGRLIFDLRIAVSLPALLGAWVLMLVCVTVNFAGIYLDESRSVPSAFTAKLDRLSAINMSLDVTSVDARSSKAGIERGLEAFGGATSLAIILGGIVLRLSSLRRDARSRPESNEPHVKTSADW